MARPSDAVADREGPPRRRSAASSAAAAAAAAGTAERRVSYIVVPAAALLDVLRLVLRYVRGRVLHLIRRNSGDFGTEDEDAGEPPDAGDMVADEELRDAGGSLGGKKKNKKKKKKKKNKNKNKKNKKKNKNQNNPPGAPEKKKNRNKNQNNPPEAPKKKNHAYQYEDWCSPQIPSLEGSLNAVTATGPDTNSTPTTPASPLMVGKNDKEPRDAGVVVDKNVGGSSGGKKKKKKKNKKKNKNQNNPPGAPKKKNHAYQYKDFRPRQIPFLMVGNCRVYKEQKDLYAVYCQERPSSGPNQLCHMCILEKNYWKLENTIPPNEMILHCSKKHNAKGLECTESGCVVRVHTEQEQLLHIHFCHRLPAGWWDWDEYKVLDQ